VALTSVTKLLKLVPVTVTLAPEPLAGMVGAGNEVLLLVMVRLFMGKVLVPSLKAEATVAFKLICPALLLTFTVRTFVLLVAPNVGVEPPQLLTLLLPLALAVGLVDTV
jgi:hypothetical protein